MAWSGNLDGVPAKADDATAEQGDAAQQQGEGAGDADGAYYRLWATEEFGAKAAPALEQIYRTYFAAPSLRRPFGPPRLTSAGNMPPPPPTASGDAPLVEGDQHYHSEARRLILDELTEHQVAAIPSQSPKWTAPRLMPTPDAQVREALLKADIEDCEAAQPRWDAVWQKAEAAEPLVDPTRRNYYQAGVLTMITINRESNRMLLDVARAIEADDAGRHAEAGTHAAAALRALDAVRTAMSAAEYGKWKNWYRGDWLTGVYRTHELVQDYANHLKDPMAKLPAPASWSGWEGYFHIMQYEGDRSVDVR